MDGHFWVNYEGVVIDPYFKMYDMIKAINGLEGDRIYLPAPPLIQAVMKKKFIDSKLKDINELMTCGFLSPLKREPNCCPVNATLEWITNGGEIVFGSLGWKKKNSDEIWWEYGGADYTVADFLRK